MSDAFILCDFLGVLQRRDGSRRNILHFVAGEEAAEVQGLVGQSVVHYPVTHSTDHLHIVVHTRDDEVRQLYPHASIVHRQDGVEYRLQMPATDTLVDVV